MGKKKRVQRTAPRKQKKELVMISVGCPCSVSCEREAKCWCETGVNRNDEPFIAAAGTPVLSVIKDVTDSLVGKRRVAFTLMPDGRIVWFYDDEIEHIDCDLAILDSEKAP